MKIDKYKELKEKIENSNFENNYSLIDRILYYFSFLGNLASIVFAYFFVNLLLYSATDDFWGKSFIVPLISSVGLTAFELLKRFLFKQTTVNILTSKKINNEIILTVILSLLLISSSFYLSLNGAEKLADKGSKIDNKVEQKINIQTDSLSKMYDARINKLDSDKAVYLKIVSDGTKSPRIITQYNNLINSANQEIKSLQKEKDSKVLISETKLNNKSVIQKKEVSSNITSFLFISTFIELIILLGVWFDAYYSYRSYNEFDEKINDDGNYKKYIVYESLLSILYNNGKLRKGEEFEPFTKFKDIVKIKGLTANEKTLKDFLTIMKYLKISNTISNRRVAERNYEEAKELLVEHYNIK